MAFGKNKQQTSRRGLDKELILLLPILFLLTFYLFGIRARVVPTNIGDMFWYTGEEYAGDFYGYFRMQMLVLVTIVFGFYLLFCFFTGSVKLQKNKVYIPMAVYTIMVLLSYALSEHKDIALVGYLTRYEGTLSLLCYMALIFYTMHAVRSEKSVKLIIRCFSVACLILCFWGILQVLGASVGDLPAWLYMPASMKEMATLKDHWVTGAINWFFSNQNYTSFFMVFPICLFAMTCVAEEDFKKKIIYAALTGLLLFNLWQCESLGGMVGLAVSVVVAFLIAGIENVKKWCKSLGLLMLAAIISVGASLPVIMKEVKSGSADAMDALGITYAYAAEEVETDKAELRFARIEHITTAGPDIVFGFEEKEIKISTENDKLVSITDQDGVLIPEENDLLRVTAGVDEGTGYNMFQVRTANQKWLFAVVKNETYFIPPSGTGVKLGPIESIGFEGNEDFATYRGYIWSKTLPMLKETVLLGKGADTFALYYPQTDYAGRYNIGYFKEGLNIIIDKPHNMYLGIATQTGVISAIALVAVYVMYLLESVKIYRRHEFDSFMSYIGMGICIAIAGFMVSALVNDSTVQMMPVVYVLLGMGFAINRMLKEK